MKFATLSFAAALQLATAYVPQCNPATHCPSMSIECMACNVRLDASCDPKEPDSIGQGLCVEPAALDFKGLVYGMDLNERCRRMVDPQYKSADKEPKPKDYIHACREGQYTCKDGFCETAKQFPKKCYKGIVNSDHTDSTCNVKKDSSVVTKLQEFFQGVDHAAYCTTHGGVRYGPIRCDNIAIVDPNSNPDCPAGTDPKPPTCSDDGDTISLFGPADACSATCNDYKELFNYPGCCMDNDVQVCSRFTVYRPQEEVGRCSEEELTSGCDVCQRNSVVENGYPYCCNDGEYPKCVDAEGRDAAGNTTPCSSTSGPFPGLKGDVCYVDSSGSTAEPPKISDTGFGASGVELTFKFDKDDELEPENDCCCDLVCSCFGDPHCTSFFGDYEVSQKEDGEYLMVEEGDFKMKGELAEPLGITSVYTIKMGDMTVEIDAEKCAFGQGIYVDGELVEDTSDIDGVDYRRTTNRPTKDDKKPYTENKKLNKHLAINPAFVFLSHGKYTAEVTCLRFLMTRGPDQGWWTRLDATVRRSVDEVPGAPGCCPGKEEVFDKLVRNGEPDGFCFRHPSEEGFYLPEGQDLTGIGRRLSAAEQAVVGARDLSFETNTELAERLAKAADISVVKAKMLIADQGKKAIRELIRNIEDNCKYYASDEVFDYDSANQCEGGLVLEAKKPTQSKWTPIRFFPKNVKYCDDKVLVLYEHTEVNGKKLDNTYELRLKSCTPDKNTCGELVSKPCQPYGGVQDLGVSKFVYGSTLTDAMTELLDYASQECECLDNPVQCIMLCVTAGSCPQKGSCTE